IPTTAETDDFDIVLTAAIGHALDDRVEAGDVAATRENADAFFHCDHPGIGTSSIGMSQKRLRRRMVSIWRSLGHPPEAAPSRERPERGRPKCRFFGSAPDLPRQSARCYRWQEERPR